LLENSVSIIALSPESAWQSDKEWRQATNIAQPQEATTAPDQLRLADGTSNLRTKGTGLWLLCATLSDSSQHQAWVQLK
jgi:hypothetical protein